MTTPTKITPAMAKVMRAALLADPVANRELFDSNQPGHKLRVEEWRQLGDIQNAEFKAVDGTNV